MRVRRSLAGAAVAVCAVAVIAACADTVNGSGSARRAASTPASGPSDSGFPSSGSAPTGFPSSGTTNGAGPASYLISAPTGSEPGSSQWAKTTSPSVTAFVQRFYDASDVTDELARLQTEGVSGVAHRLWLQNNEQVDVVLLQFSNAGGSTIRHTGVVLATEKDTTFRSTRPAIAGDVTEFYAVRADSDGNIVSRAYGLKGNIALEVFALSPRTFDSTTLTKYTAAQIAKLP